MLGKTILPVVLPLLFSGIFSSHDILKLLTQPKALGIDAKMKAKGKLKTDNVKIFITVLSQLRCICLPNSTA